MQQYLAINGFVTCFFALFFGYLVISRDKKNIINQTLFLLTLATALWSFGYWRWLLEYDNANNALFWTRILSIGSIFLPIFYFHWIISLLNVFKKYKYVVYSSYLLSILLLAFSFSPLFVSHVDPIEGVFAYWPKPGIIYSFYLAVVYTGLVSYAIILLINSFRNSSGIYRRQLFYVLLGTVLGFGGGATNFFLWYDIDILPYGGFLVISYPILFSYAIVKHRLMDVKFVMRKYSVYIASIISILLLVLIVKYILIEIFTSVSTFVDFLFLAISLVIYPKIKDTYFRLANKYFFSSLYDSKDLIAELSDELGKTLEIRKIYNLIHKSLLNALHFKSFIILKYSEKSDSYLIQFNRGFDIGRKKKFPANLELSKLFNRGSQIVIVDELKKNTKIKRVKKAVELFDKIGAEIFVPLNIKDKTIGLLVFGSKESRDLYNDEDLQVLQIISSQVAMAVENATLYQETINFNIKLASEVEKATHDLRLANDKLTRLDQAKSEFISIASHQLRTPLTVIKGYISMMLEKSFGELNSAELEALKKVYDSNERLIKLVENLLNISRIESGRLQFMFEDMHLETVVDSVMEELETTAKKKKLRLYYKKPSKFLPLVKLDTEKIRQVIMNLIDNSIKYTNKGSVTVALRQVKKNIEFSVSDSGMGISKTDLKSLFKKFSRGKDVSLVHTEGTGLGLYVAKQMVQSHHGKIWAESKGVGKGSKFVFTLPIVK
jgi:signal transduction histidine kinase